MAGWCGKTTTAVVAGTLNPCYFNTAAATRLAAAAVVVALIRGSSARRLAATARGRAYLLQLPAGAVHGAQLGAAALLAALHGFALLWVTTQVPQPPFVEYSEALLLLAWAAFAVRWHWVGWVQQGAQRSLAVAVAVLWHEQHGGMAGHGHGRSSWTAGLGHARCQLAWESPRVAHVMLSYGMPLHACCCSRLSFPITLPP